ncbi:MAG TPA: lipopolysaccharide biosynthesis protein [Roseiflexaceae bacterium]|nr:lipopolysaccharide biosynthesis protein [Roseiflexaceae bacterium]
MRSNLIHLARQTVGYGVGMAVSRLAGVILAPIYTRVLSPADYGAWGVINTVLTIVALLALFGVDVAWARLYFETEDAHKRRRLAGTAFWSALVWTIGLVGLALGAAPAVAEQLLGRSAYTPYLRLALLTVPFSVLHALQLFMLRLRFALVAYNVLALGNLVLGAGLSVLLAGGLGYGLRGIFLGILAGYACTSLAGWWINRHMIGRWSRPLLWPLLVMGLPLMPAGLGHWALSYVDRWFLTRAVAPAELGLYELANKLTAGIALFTGAFQSAWGPFSYWIERREGSLRTYAKALTYYTLFTLGGALALGLFAREALMLVTPPAFHGAYLAVAPLSYAPVAYGAYTLLSTGATLSKQTATLAATMILAALANLALNLLLITWWGWGIIGAACATGGAFLLAAVLVYRAAQRVYPIPYETSKLLRALAIQLALMAALPISVGLPYWPGLALRLGALLAYLPLCWLAGCLDAWEVQLILRALRQPHRLLGWVAGRAP